MKINDVLDKVTIEIKKTIKIDHFKLINKGNGKIQVQYANFNEPFINVKHLKELIITEKNINYILHVITQLCLYNYEKLGESNV